MTQRPPAIITSVGICLPAQVLGNHELAPTVGVSEEWIQLRTGIQERRVVEPGTPTSVLAIGAARDALRKRGLTADDVELIIVATVTPDMPFPATACLVQDAIGAKRAWAFDISAACSGFLYSLTVGAQFVQSGAHRTVLVIGADVMSSVVDRRDRGTSVLFGDGAGAILLEPASTASAGLGILDFFHEVDGSGAPLLCMPAGGSARPATTSTVERGLHHVKQDGAHVFKYAVRKLSEISEALLRRQELRLDDVDVFVPHQGNLRIVEAVAERLGLPACKLVTNIQRFGNTGAASIPLALHSALEAGRLACGRLLLMASVGAGFTAGGVLMRWGCRESRGYDVPTL
jgi:3-oxoacyl-[acyl-carrier-protein] synthase-3